MLTPQAAKETKEEVEKETPPVEPSPAPEPEVVLPIPRPVTEKKPEEEKPQEEMPKQQSADQVVAAPLTMAPPRVEAKEEPVSAAPSPGISAAAARATPRGKRRSSRTSIASSAIRTELAPAATRATWPSSSGSTGREPRRLARRAQLRVVGARRGGACRLERASPLPAPPAQVSGTTFDLALPIQFRIR